LPGVGVVERDAGSELVAALEWADREERNVDSFSSGLSARALDTRRDATGGREVMSAYRRAGLMSLRRVLDLGQLDMSPAPSRRTYDKAEFEQSKVFLPVHTSNVRPTAILFTPDTVGRSEKMTHFCLASKWT
jgi:hypothetical protein